MDYEKSWDSLYCIIIDMISELAKKESHFYKEEGLKVTVAVSGNDPAFACLAFLPPLMTEMEDNGVEDKKGALNLLLKIFEQNTVKENEPNC